MNVSESEEVSVHSFHFKRLKSKSIKLLTEASTLKHL